MEDNIFKPTAIKAKETLVHNSERSSSFCLEGTHRTAPTHHWFYQYKKRVKLAHPRNGGWYEVSMRTSHPFQSHMTLSCLVL